MSATETNVPTQIMDLMADAKPRTAGEIAGQLSAGADFTAMRQLGRQVASALPELVSREYLRRLVYWLERGGREERYILASVVRPVCLSCFSAMAKDEYNPAQMTGNAMQLCSICGRRTNNGAYLLEQAEDQ